MRFLDLSTAYLEDEQDGEWRDLTGSPRRWLMHSGRKIRIVPKSIVTLTIGYLEAPVAMVSDSDTPDTRIPIPHHAHLKYAAGAFLLRMDGDNQDEPKAAAFMQTFNSLISHREEPTHG